MRYVHFVKKCVNQLRLKLQVIPLFADFHTTNINSKWKLWNSQCTWIRYVKQMWSCCVIWNGSELPFLPYTYWRSVIIGVSAADDLIIHAWNIYNPWSIDLNLHINKAMFLLIDHFPQLPWLHRPIYVIQ